MRMQLELNEQQKNMFAARTNFFQKLINKLNDRLRRYESDTVSASATATADLESKTAVPDAKEKAPESVTALKERVSFLEDTARTTQAELEHAYSQLHRMRHTREAARTADDATTFLLICFEDARLQLAQKRLDGGEQPAGKRGEGTHSSSASQVRWQPEHGVPSHLADLRLEDRERLLDFLLHFLQAAPPGLLLPPIGQRPTSQQHAHAGESGRKKSGFTSSSSSIMMAR